jgi:hypothetical protein
VTALLEPLGQGGELFEHGGETFGDHGTPGYEARAGHDRSSTRRPEFTRDGGYRRPR